MYNYIDNNPYKWYSFNRDKIFGYFIWDKTKEQLNINKHGVDFVVAIKAFNDRKRKIYVDLRHNVKEERFFCIGKVDGRVLTVRFTYRLGKIRIFGAGYWRKGKEYYEKDND